MALDNVFSILAVIEAAKVDLPDPGERKES
jgi:hypothetical protein